MVDVRVLSDIQQLATPDGGSAISRPHPSRFGSASCIGARARFSRVGRPELACREAGAAVASDYDGHPVANSVSRDMACRGLTHWIKELPEVVLTLMFHGSGRSAAG